MLPVFAPEVPLVPEIPGPPPWIPLSWWVEDAPVCVCTAPPAGKDVATLEFIVVLEVDVGAAESPGKTPDPDRRAMSARTALSHLISSSSLGAQRRRVLFVVTTLNVCRTWVSSSPSGAEAESCGEETGWMLVVGLCLWDGRSYSSASRICASGIWRCGLLSYENITT